MDRTGKAGVARRGADWLGEVGRGRVRQAGQGSFWSGRDWRGLAGEDWQGLVGLVRTGLAGEEWRGMVRQGKARHGAAGMARLGMVW